MANCTSHAALGEDVVELADLVLRLRHGHAVARNDDDAGAASRIAAASSGVADRTGRLVRACRGGGLHLPERAEQHVRKERFIALHMMIERIKPEAPSARRR